MKNHKQLLADFYLALLERTGRPYSVYLKRWLWRIEGEQII